MGLWWPFYPKWGFFAVNLRETDLEQLLTSSYPEATRNGRTEQELTQDEEVFREQGKGSSFQLSPGSK
jgi:hypothetical protein